MAGLFLFEQVHSEAINYLKHNDPAKHYDDCPKQLIRFLPEYALVTFDPPVNRAIYFFLHGVAESD